MNMNALSSCCLPWLRLARISALPSAISNILVGYLLVQQNWTPIGLLLLLVFSSASLYTAGMILNDVFDYEIDQKERPHRPIPSGQIDRRTATWVGFGLLIVGVLLAGMVSWQVGMSTQNRGLILWRPVLVAIGLAVMILLYDGLLKKTLIAPVLMGGCRTLNVLLGASASWLTAEPNELISGFPALVWWVAISIGIFVTGLTLLARREAAENQSRGRLILAALAIAAGLIGIAALSKVFGQMLGIKAQLINTFPMLIGLISLPILRRVIIAVASESPQAIQTAVVTCLRSMIVLDAAVCFLVAPDQPMFALIVVGLLIPGMLLGRLVSVT
jgi:4-hydroxybenzoate polyprenyltransferase